MKLKRRYLKGALLAILVGSIHVPHAVWAQNEQEADAVNTRDVIVSATKTEMQIKDVPASVVVITREQIEERKASNLSDVLRDVPGIQFTRSGSLSSGNPIRIRGSEGDHVLILVDGKRLSMDPSWQNTRELERIRMDDVERVEIVKGPSSALYGSSAMGGVINIITRRPTKDSVELYTSYKLLEGASGLNSDVGLYMQGAKQGNFSWTLSAARNYIHNLSFEPYKQEYPSGTEIPVNFKGIFDFNDNHKLQLDFRYVKEKTDYDVYYKNPVNASRENLSRNDIRRLDYGLDYTGKNKQMSWQLRAYRASWEKDQNTYHKTTRLWKDFDIIKADQDVIEGQVSGAVGDHHQVTVGGMFAKERVESSRMWTDGIGGTGADSEYWVERNGTSKKIGKRTRNNYAMYLQDEWMAGSKWLLIPAVRLEEYDGFGSETTPRFGASYFARPDLRFKANIAKGYRAPTILELYRYTTPTGMRGNPNLKPESSKSVEFIIEKDWDKHSAQIAFYRNDVENLITMESQPGGYYMNVNVDESLLQGIEVSTRYRLSDAVQLNFGYNYLDAENSKTKERLTGRPRHQFIAGTSYQQAPGMWKVNVDAKFMTDYIYTDDFNEQHEASYLIFNVLAERKFGKNNNQSFYIGVENLFNKKLYDMSEYGRTYVVGTSYKF